MFGIEKMLTHYRELLYIALETYSLKLLREPMRRSPTVITSVTLLLLTLTTALAEPPQKDMAIGTVVPAFCRYDLPATLAISKLAVGDFNGDKHLDIAALEQRTGKIAVFYGNSCLEFASPKLVAVAGKAIDLKATDANRDGISDLIVLSDAPEKIACYVGGALEKMTLQGELDAERGTEKIYVETRFSKTTVFAIGQWRGVDCIEVSSNGELTRMARRASESAYWQLAVTESVEHRNGGDLLLADATERKIRLARNSADSLAGATQLRFEADVFAVSCADFNQNQLPDAVIALAPKRAGEKSALLRVIYDVGVQTGTPPLTLPCGESPSIILTDDINGDGVKDLLVLDRAGQTVFLYLAKGASGFLDPISLGVGGVEDMVVADLNGDRKPDIVFADEQRKRLVIFSTTPRDERQNIERIVTRANPIALATARRRQQSLLLVAGKAETVSVLNQEKHLAYQKSFVLESKPKFLWQVQDSGELLCLAESPEKLTMYQVKSTSLEKAAELPILTLNVASAEFWNGDGGAPTLLMLLDEGNQEILPRVLTYHISRDGAPHIDEISLYPELPAEKMLFINKARVGKKTGLAALSVNDNQMLAARLFEFGSIEARRLKLVETKQLVLVPYSADDALHTALVEDFDGDQKPDWLLISQTKSLLFLSSKRYRAERLRGLRRVDKHEFIRAIDVNQDKKLDLLVGNRQKATLTIMLNSGKGVFSVPIVVDDIDAQDAKSLKHDGVPVLAVANARLHTIDFIRFPQGMKTVVVSAAPR